MLSNSKENFDTLSDAQLVSLYNKGNHELLTVIIKKYMSVISFYANKLGGICDIDDMVQDGIVALYTAVKNYREGQASFKTFATLCIKRAMLSELKAGRRKKDIPGELVSSLDDLEITDSNSPEKIFFDNESFKALTDTIELELSTLEYKVLLSFLSGKNYSGIAEELGLSVKSVDNSLRRVRKKLKDI